MDLFVLRTWIQAKFTDSERGASMVEYGLLLGLIAIIALVAVQAFGNGVSEKFSSINSAVN
jgi:pilus assembly protein Flp/PilA